MARRLVAEMFPSAVAAWLGGSVVRGDATRRPTSTSPCCWPVEPAPYRHSLRYGDWPVELFVHTEESFEWFLAKDLDRRQPSLARLVAESVLVTGEDVLGDRARGFLAVGSPPLSAADLAAARYAITDLLDDLTGSTSEVETVGIATRLWEESLRLLLTGSGHWAGSGQGSGPRGRRPRSGPRRPLRRCAALGPWLGRPICWSPGQTRCWRRTAGGCSTATERRRQRTAPLRPVLRIQRAHRSASLRARLRARAWMPGRRRESSRVRTHRRRHR